MVEEIAIRDTEECRKLSISLSSTNTLATTSQFIRNFIKPSSPNGYSAGATSFDNSTLIIPKNGNYYYEDYTLSSWYTSYPFTRSVKNFLNISVTSASQQPASRTLTHLLSKDIGERLYYIKNLHFYSMTIAFGALAFLVAKVCVKVRQKIYHEEGNIDRAFDAGRRVTFGLIASLLISNWTWAATLLQSSTVAAKYGISGAFWYAAGASVQLILFSILAIQLKVIAPGAKTFLQIIRVRFGTKCHVVYCAMAILTNVIVTSLLLLGGYGACKYLIEDISILNFSVLMIAVIGSYTMIGGFVGTLYVSYFNTALIFILLLYMCHELYSDKSVLGGLENIYNYVSCLQGPPNNLDQSYLTLISLSGLQFGIINLIGNFGAVFIDESYWNCAIASKPKGSVIGFTLGGLIWFSIPFTLATAGGLTFRALEFVAGKPLLKPEDIDKGLVLPRVLALMLGIKGTYIIYFALLMAISSTASANIVAVSSIVTYDIFQPYVRPFRRTTDINSCLLCGKQRGRKSNIRDRCVCVSKTYCSGCNNDDRDLISTKYTSIRPIFKCKIHGNFRNYYSDMENRKTWIMLITILCILPLTFTLNQLNINLNWLYQFMGIIIGSAIVPVCLSLYWGQLTSTSMIFGALLGCAAGIISWAIVSASAMAFDQKKRGIYKIDGNQTNSFFEYSGREFPMVLGNIIAILTGGLITTFLSFIHKPKRDKTSIVEIWETTRDIDNPLSPWVEIYDNDFDLKDTHYLDDRPHLEEVKIKYHKLSLWTMTISVSVIVIIIVIWPSVTCLLKVFAFDKLKQWVNFSLVILWSGMIFIVIVPLVLEINEFIKQIKKSKKIDMLTLQVPKAIPKIQTTPSI